MEHNEIRKFDPMGHKFYVTFKDKEGKKYFCTSHWGTYIYEKDGKVEDTSNYAEEKKNWVKKIRNAIKTGTPIDMQQGPHCDDKKVDPNNIVVESIVFEDHNPNRIFDIYEQ